MALLDDVIFKELFNVIRCLLELIRCNPSLKLCNWYFISSGYPVRDCFCVPLRYNLYLTRQSGFPFGWSVVVSPTNTISSFAETHLKSTVFLVSTTQLISCNTPILVWGWSQISSSLILANPYMQLSISNLGHSIDHDKVPKGRST